MRDMASVTRRRLKSRATRVQWPELVTPACSLHLLVAALPDASTQAQIMSAQSAQMLVRRLLKMLPLTGRYAVTISRAQGRPEIMCAFEDVADANQAAQVVDATSVEPRAGWASQFTFLLDEKAEKRVLKTAGPGEPWRPRGARVEE